MKPTLLAASIACFAWLAGCGTSPQPAAPTARPASPAPESIKPQAPREYSYKDPNGNEAKLTIRSGLPSSAAGLDEYPRIKGYVDSRGYSVRETPVNKVFAADFETTDEPEAVLEFYGKQFTVMRRNQQADSRNIAGKFKSGGSVSVTVRRPKDSALTTVNVRVFRTK